MFTRSELELLRMENAGLRERLMQREQRSAAYIDLQTKAAYIEASMDAKRMRALPCVAASDAAALAAAAGMGRCCPFAAATRVADEAKAAASALGYQNAAEAASLEDADDLPVPVKTVIDASAAAAAAAATAERAAQAEEERWRRGYPRHGSSGHNCNTMQDEDEDAEIATQWAAVVSMAQSALTAAATQEGIAVERAGGPLIVARYRGRPAAATAAAAAAAPAAAAPAEQTEFQIEAEQAEASLQAIQDRVAEAFEPIEAFLANRLAAGDAFLATAAAEPIAKTKARPKAKLSSKRKQPTA